MSKAVKLYQQAKGNPYTLDIIVGVGALVVGYFAYKKFFPDPGTDDAKAKDAASIDVNAANLTKPDYYYSNLADSIASAIDSWSFDSTYENAVIKPLQGLNRDEILLVVKDFGTRQYSGLTHPLDRGTYNLRSYAEQALPSAVWDELNPLLTAAGI